ncbi:tubulin polyglutamylase ttll6-like isoform X3 [Rhodnius prolixus]|uniref:tubulin polyglutamylase ttll6-like isoform X3 n=1 Tax=Rhodnius prolixus TaxID=13249 RepID=UPI003D189A2C
MMEDGEFKCESNPSSRVLTSSKRRRRRNRPGTICTMNCRYEIVRDVAESFGMKEASDGWNVYWTDMSVNHDRCKEMKRYQRVNHFPGMLEICRKDLLARNLNRMLKLFPSDYNFYPRSWCLPTELNEVLEFCKVYRNKPLIVKPDIGCQGKGIFITKNLNDIKDLDKMICQVYISKPFLIDGYKFDLRVYVLITSCDPLRIYVYNEGLVRFATKRYKEPNGSNISNMYMHLTNYSVNKHSRAYVNDAEGGSKRRISTINHWLMDRFYNTERLWKAVDDVIIKTIIVALPSLNHSYHACFPNHDSLQACFELLGFDFILDNKLNPFLLEVNHSPSFHTETDIDLEIKEALLKDTFNLLNLSSNDKQKILSEDRKRIRNRLLGPVDKKPFADKCEEKIKLQEKSMKALVEWESSHLGNFRQAYPSENDRKYEAFFNVNSSLYCDTHASRAREIVTKKDKDELQTKQDSKTQTKISKLKDSNKLSCSKNDLSGYSSYDPVVINEVEEEERLADMKKREQLIYNHGVLEKIYNGFKSAGRLQLEDEIRYGRHNNWYHSNTNDLELNGISAKKKLQRIYRLLSQRGLFLSSQEIPLTNTLIRMSSNNNETKLPKMITLTRNTPESSPDTSLSSVSLSSSDDKENLNSNIKPINIDINPTPVENAKIVKQINANEEKPIVKENEVIINGTKITCNETFLNDEPWILISSKKGPQ